MLDHQYGGLESGQIRQQGRQRTWAAGRGGDGDHRLACCVSFGIGPGAVGQAAARMPDDVDLADLAYQATQFGALRSGSTAEAEVALQGRRRRGPRPWSRRAGRRFGQTGPGSASECDAMICSMACWLWPSGRCRSRITTSGRSCATCFDRAAAAVLGWPTTTMSPSRRSTSMSWLRCADESSTTSARTMRPSFRRTHALVPSRRLTAVRRLASSKPLLVM